jgi:hypothetical protein
VIERRLANTHAMLAQWELEGERPAARIRSFIHILLANGEKIKRHGCPVGTLCSELSKLNHDATGAANELFTLFRTWLRREFERLDTNEDADALAMHVLAGSQGVATLANAFHDQAFIEAEVARLCAWLDTVTETSAPPD